MAYFVINVVDSVNRRPRGGERGERGEVPPDRRSTSGVSNRQPSVCGRAAIFRTGVAP